MAKVKICGVTNDEDALWAANLGADYVGLNFYAESPRKVSIKKAQAIVDKMPPFVEVVGVFVDEPIASIKKAIEKVPLKFVQLHGHETPEYCQDVKTTGARVIKVIGITKPLETGDVAAYEPVVDFFLFDHQTPEMPGGTGEAFDWAFLENTSFLTKPWFLAGGLKPDTVAKAIKQVHPPLVDVCSGVERLPTRKDYDAMKTFIQTVRSAK